MAGHKTSRANVTKIVNWEITLSLLKKVFSIGTMNENVVAALFVTAYAGSAGVTLRNPKKKFMEHMDPVVIAFLFFLILKTTSFQIAGNQKSFRINRPLIVIL